MRFPFSQVFVSVFVQALLTTAIHAQGVDPVPLKNWPAPLSWQPTRPEEIAPTGKELAQNFTPLLKTPGSSTSLGVLVAITPCRLVDTRYSMPIPYGGGASIPLAWAADSLTSINATALPAGAYSGVPRPCNGSAQLPVAIAYSSNITMIPTAPGQGQFISVCPGGTTKFTCQQTAALTDYIGAAVLSNGVVIPADGTGTFEVYNQYATRVVIDINGYYVSPTAFALGAGTAVAPSLTFSNDTNSGFYSSSAGTVKVTSSGADILTVNSSGISVNGNVNVAGTGHGVSYPDGTLQTTAPEVYLRHTYDWVQLPSYVTTDCISLSLPAGTFFVSAKAEMRVPGRTTCYLDSTYSSTLNQHQYIDFDGEMSLSGLVINSPAAQIVLRCRANTSNWSIAVNPAIYAIRVSTVHAQ